MWLLFCLLEEPSPSDLAITKARGVQEDKKANRGINHSRPLQSTSVPFFCNILIRFLLSARISVTGSRNSFHCPVRRGSEVWLLFFTITFWIFPPPPFSPPLSPPLSSLLSHRDLCSRLRRTRSLRRRHLPLRGGLDGHSLWSESVSPTLQWARDVPGRQVWMQPGLERRALHYW